MQRTVIAVSTNPDFEHAFAEVTDKIKNECASPKLIMFFSEYNSFYMFATKLQEAFPNTVNIGSTSYINFSSAGYGHNSLAAMAINDGIEVGEGILFDVSNFPMNYKRHIALALDKLSSFENTCCIEFCNSYTKGEELVLDTLNKYLSPKGIPCFGSSAGAELSEGSKSIVSLNGVCFQNTCVFVLIHNLNGKIGFVKENLYEKTTDKVFSATDVDVDNRIIYMLDNKPAADVLASALNVPLENLKDAIAENPLGRISKDKVFITEVSDIMPDGSIQLFARVFNHSKIAILNRGNINEIWNATKETAREQIAKNSFAIVVNCLARSIMFEKENLFSEFTDTLKNNYGNYIGVSGYGEQYNITHMNQTLILVLFE